MRQYERNQSKFKGGKQDRRDKRFGIREEGFWWWWHHGKQKVHRRNDLTKVEALDLYGEWISLGRPKPGAA